jgi:hypothetical protein
LTAIKQYSSEVENETAAQAIGETKLSAWNSSGNLAATSPSPLLLSGMYGSMGNSMTTKLETIVEGSVDRVGAGDHYDMSSNSSIMGDTPGRLQVISSPPLSVASSSSSHRGDEDYNPSDGYASSSHGEERSLVMEDELANIEDEELGGFALAGLFQEDEAMSASLVVPHYLMNSAQSAQMHSVGNVASLVSLYRNSGYYANLRRNTRSSSIWSDSSALRTADGVPNSVSAPLTRNLSNASATRERSASGKMVSISPSAVTIGSKQASRRNSLVDASQSNQGMQSVSSAQPAIDILVPNHLVNTYNDSVNQYLTAFATIKTNRGGNGSNIAGRHHKGGGAASDVMLSTHSHIPGTRFVDDNTSPSLDAYLCVCCLGLCVIWVPSKCTL